jgi:hypothetical protein
VLAEGLAAAKTAGAEHELVRKQEDKTVILYNAYRRAMLFKRGSSVDGRLRGGERENLVARPSARAAVAAGSVPNIGTV